MPHASRRPVLLLAVALLTGACTTTASPSTAATAAPTDQPTEAATAAPTTAPTVAPSPSPTPVPGPVACTAADLTARVTLWDAGAGQRYGTVALTNKGAAPCDLPKTATPQLVDGGGNVLIAGKPAAASGTITLGAGAVVKTTVAAGNYCGPAPTAPISVAFVFGNGAYRIVAAPLSATDTAGLPPCNGDPGSAGSIDMQPWAP